MAGQLELKGDILHPRAALHWTNCHKPLWSSHYFPRSCAILHDKVAILTSCHRTLCDILHVSSTASLDLWASVTLPYQFMSLATYRSRFVAVGGRDHIEPTNVLHTSISGLEWEPSLPPMPTKRYMTSSVSARSPEALVVAGGKDSQHNRMNVIEVLLEDKWTSVDFLPSPDCGMHSTFHDGKIFFMRNEKTKNMAYSCGFSSLISLGKKSTEETVPLWEHLQTPGEKTTVGAIVSFSSNVVSINGNAIVRVYSSTAKSWVKATSVGKKSKRHGYHIAASSFSTREIVFIHKRGGVYLLQLSISPFSLQSDFTPNIFTRLEASGVKVATLLENIHLTQGSSLDLEETKIGVEVATILEESHLTLSSIFDLQEIEKVLLHWSDGLIGDRPPCWGELLRILKNMGLEKLYRKINDLLQVQVEIVQDQIENNMESENLKYYLSQIPEQFHKNLDEQIDDEILCKTAECLTGWIYKYDLLELTHKGMKAIELDNNSAESQRKAALMHWKNELGLLSTYRNLLVICICGNWQDSAKDIVDFITSQKRSFESSGYSKHPQIESKFLDNISDAGVDFPKNCAVIISKTELKEINELKVREKHDDLKILYMNHLTKLPEKLVEFKENITCICIQNKNFQEIPDILYEFDKLQHLNMHGNYLCRISTNITTFKNLTRLYLGDNDITFLPDVFDSFQNLQKASFEKNDLTRLPPSFRTLRMLETLDLSENNIVIFPQALFDLQLKNLNIERNKIQIIIAEESDEEKAISFFRNLSHLQMRNNLFIVDEQLDLKKGSLIASQNEKLKLSRPLRVNVLGNSGAGKSSLVQALTIQKYVVPTSRFEHRHTIGIERHFLPLDINGKTVVLHIWDYAGDDEYAMMNDLFITDGSLVWLVVNLAKYMQQSKSDNDEKVFYANVGDWLLRIMSHYRNPNVWIICTHRDMCSEALACEIIQQIKQCVESLCQRDEGKSIALIKNVKYINLTNTFSFTGFEKIYEEFKNLLGSTSFLSGPLPVQWIKSIDALQEKAELKISKFESPVISSKELEEELSDMQVFLRYYHDVGEIYTLNEPLSDNSSKKMVIFSPKWLIGLLKLVYHHDFKQYLDGVSNNPEFLSIYPDDLISDAAKKREKFGVISEPVLKALWKCHKNENLFKSIIMLFQKFNLTIPSSKSYYNDKIIFHFFPYCMKDKAKIKEKLASSKSIIVLKCLLPQNKMKIFLQRLALKFWEEEAEDPIIHDNGFEITIEKDVELYVLQVKSNYSNDIRIQFSSDKNIDFLWPVVRKILQDIYNFLSRYSPVRDRAKLQLGLNSCLCSVYFPLLEVIEEVYENICPKYVLKCRKCGSTTPIDRAVAKSTLQLLKIFGHDCSPIYSENELIRCFSGREKFELVKNKRTIH